MNCTPIVRHNLTIGGAVFLTKFTAEEKQQAVKRYLTGGESSYDIADSLKTDKSMILLWVKQYEHNGVNAFLSTYTSYTQQFKMNVLNYMIEHGISYLETAAIFNISSPTTIKTWKRQFEANGMEALQSKKKGRSSVKKEVNKPTKQASANASVEALEKRIQQLEMENEYLKKLNALAQNKGKSPNKIKRNSSMS